MWGNDEYGDCVLAGEANQVVRLERIETHRTIALSDDDAIARYKEMTGCKEPGDDNDTGLVMLDSFRAWRNDGWHHGQKDYKIDAYGLVPLGRHDALRAAVFYLNGIQFGLALPTSAEREFPTGTWAATAEEPGTWGGHAVYCDGYNSGGFFIWTWGQRIYMTNSFVDRYADEQWGVVDALDNHSRWLDIDKLESYLNSLTTQVNG